MALSKIDKFNMGQAVLDLFAKGKNTYEIADAVSEMLKDQGIFYYNGGDPIPERVSQPTVARYLKEVRKERAEETRAVVHEHVKAHIPKDLEALEEIEGFFLSIFRNVLIDPETKEPMIDAATGKIMGAGYDDKTRGAAAMQAKAVIETKLKYAGILEEQPDKPGDGKKHNIFSFVPEPKLLSEGDNGYPD